MNVLHNLENEKNDKAENLADDAHALRERRARRQQWLVGVCVCIHL